jgi:hypothetical protein
MKINKTILVLTALVSFGAGATRSHARSAGKDPIPTITVCEALEHPAEYDGKMVHIRDDTYSNGEGAWFVGKSCPGVFVTEGKVWPSTIAWTMPANSMTVLHPVEFRYDSDSSKRTEKKYQELRKRFPARCLRVTYTGMFEIWSKEKARKTDSKGHKYEFAGFGHLNGAPAQLVMKSHDDVSVIPNCHAKKLKH